MDKFQEVKEDILSEVTTLFDEYNDDNEKKMLLCEILINLRKMLETQEEYNEVIKILRQSGLEKKEQDQTLTKAVYKYKR